MTSHRQALGDVDTLRCGARCVLGLAKAINRSTSNLVKPNFLFRQGKNVADSWFAQAAAVNDVSVSPSDGGASVALQNPILSPTLNHISLDQIKAEKGAPPWSHAVALADHVVGVVIHQDETAANDNHCHTYDEFWVVLEGEIHWQIEGRGVVHAKAGDFVYVPARTFHHIHPQGLSVRVGVALPGHGHLHDRPARKVNIEVESPDDIPKEAT